MARGFSGDKEQLVPILKAGVAHRGFALIDVVSPCVTFNDHEGSTRSYLHRAKIRCAQRKLSLSTRAADHPGDPPNGVASVTMHDCSVVLFTRTPPDYDVTDRAKASAWLKAWGDEVATGIFFVDEDVQDLHEASHTPRTPLAHVAYEDYVRQRRSWHDCRKSFDTKAGGL